MLRETDTTTDDPNANWYTRTERRKGHGPSALVLLEKSGRASVSRSSLGNNSREGPCRKELPVHKLEYVLRGGVFEEGPEQKIYEGGMARKRVGEK